MGEKREMYSELLFLPVKDVPIEALEKFVDSCTSGIDCFYDAVEDVELWISWFKYTLPYLVLRAHERHMIFHLLDLIVSAFMRIFGDRVDSVYPEFRKDAIETVGQALMKKEFWDKEGNICLYTDHWHDGKGNPSLVEPRCSGIISSSICFCLMYLPAANVLTWTKSLLAIECMEFKGHLLVWLVAIYQTLSETSTSKTTFSFSAMNDARFGVDWNGSIWLGTANPPIPEENIARFLATIRSDLTSEKLSEWSKEFAQLNYLRELTKSFAIFEYVQDVILAKPD